MKHQSFKSFSLLELLVVVLVILTLLSLIIPSVRKLYQKSNTILCAKNLKDVHGMINSYSLDHMGVLPGYAESDLPQFKYSEWEENSSLYRYWNGHLINYIDPQLDIANLKRETKLFKDGTLIELHGKEANPNATDYKILEQALKGEGSTKVFYCPEVFYSDIISQDVHDYTNGKVNVPKMFNLSGWQAIKTSNHVHVYGLPTCYVANDAFFGVPDASGGSIDGTERKKISSVKNFGQKILLMEGGNTMDQFLNSPYFTGKGTDVQGADLGFHMRENSQFSYNKSLFTFAHDDEGELWYSRGRVNLDIMKQMFHRDQFNSFNELHTPNSYVAPCGGDNSMSTRSTGIVAMNWMTFVTHINPDISNESLLALENEFGWSWNSSFSYVGSEDVRLSPSTGSSNVLYADGTVKNKHAAWLFVNRLELFSDL